MIDAVRRGAHVVGGTGMVLVGGALELSIATDPESTAAGLVLGAGAFLFFGGFGVLIALDGIDPEEETAEETAESDASREVTA